MSNFRSSCLFALALAIPVAAQSARPTAIVDARILTLAGPPVERGTVLIEDGRIAAVGTDVKVPPGAKRIDARGGTIVPGLVSAFSRAGLSVPRRSVARPSRRFSRRFRGFSGTPAAKPENAAATKVAESLYPRQDVFAELLACGVTTLAVAPAGSGFPGLAATVDASQGGEDGFFVDDDAYLVVGMAANTGTKQLLKKSLDAAKKVLEDRKKPKEPEKKPEAESKPSPEGEKPASQPEAERTEGEKPKPDQPKPEEPEPKPDEKDGEKKPAAKKTETEAAAKKPAKKTDPNAEVLADLLDRSRRAFVEAGSANELAHYVAAIGDHGFDSTVVVARHDSYGGLVHEAIEQIKKLEASVLLVPELTTPAYSAELIDPAAELREAGIEVGFLVGDSKEQVRQLFFKLIELVRGGQDPADVLRSVSLTPAKFLGIDAEVGTIETGKRADLLLFDGDPFDPTTRLVQVFHGGRPVREEATR